MGRSEGKYQQQNGPQIFQLRRELMNHTLGQFSVSTYFTKLKKIWEELSNYRPVCHVENAIVGDLISLLITTK